MIQDVNLEGLVVKFIQHYGFSILIFLVIIILFGKVIYRRIQLSRANRRIKSKKGRK